MSRFRPSLSPRWIEPILADLATLHAVPSAAQIEALSARIAAQAFSPHAPRASGSPGYRRHLLTQGSDVPYSCLLIEWPASHATPIHDHAGLWGLELVLDGALEVEEFALAGDSVLPRLARSRALMLGVGDSACFTGEQYAHRCRNLSAARPALSLHVYGGTLDRYRSFHADMQGGHAVQMQQAAIDSAPSA
ncbi:cysteine dioxygenase family protein [Dokdonella sp.]|uniref:cysteine dioxygenase n=1 Tax=Dokdonella sp. TaxID=2291710 RepID=UPI00260F8D58|nr:cysteine dioxygenase family protein [Dokdonella sp.]